MSEGRRLTRRDVLSRAAVAAGAGVLLGPTAARAAAVPQDAGGRVFGHELGTLRAGVARSVAVGRPVCLAAVRWSEPAHADLEMRARRADGRWGPWGSAACGGHDGDDVPGDGRIGEGVWVGRSAELELRSRATVRGVGLTLVAAPAGADDGPAADLATGALPLATPTLPAGPGQPPIIARRAWAGSDHPPTAGPFYGTIEMGVVHHTENPNGYSAGAVPALLRAIYEFHVHGRGWFDIGYNFVIDRFGRIWEARQGGIDLPVSGAQAGDWNQISFGVSMLGTFSDVLPSAPALAALARLLAWKLALSGLPATGEIAEVATPDGIQWTQFHVGEHVSFPRIAGHRQVDATTCPGDVLYGHLPVLRSQTARLLGTPATLAVDATLSTPGDGGALLEVSGRLAHGSAALGGAPVVVQSITGPFGDARTLATATTDADGLFTATVPARPGLLVRALHAAAPAVASDLLSVAASPGGETAEVRRGGRLAGAPDGG